MRVGESLLRSPQLRRLWFAQLGSWVGEQLTPIALTVATLSASNSVSAVSLVLGARYVPLTLLLLPAGAWADRTGKVKLALAADTLRLGAVVGLLFVPASAGAIVWYVAIASVLGVGEAIFRPAGAALIPVIASGDKLARVNALWAASLPFVIIVGPSVGGLMSALLGPSAVFFIGGCGFALSITFLVKLRRVQDSGLAAGERMYIRGAIREVRRHRWLVGFFCVSAIQLAAAVAPETILLPVIADSDYGGPVLFGAALSTYCAGCVAGAAATNRWLADRSSVIPILGLATFCLVSGSLAIRAPVAVVLVCYFVAGAGLQPYIIRKITAMQRTFTKGNLARVLSIDALCTVGVIPIGLVLTGPAVEVVGVNNVLWFGFFCSIVPPLVLLIVPGVRDLKEPRVVAA